MSHQLLEMGAWLVDDVRLALWPSIPVLLSLVWLLITYAIFPTHLTERHYLNVAPVVGFVCISIGFIIPSRGYPRECYNAITPNDMRNDAISALTGIVLFFGAWVVIIGALFRSVALHLTVCWEIKPSRMYKNLSLSIIFIGSAALVAVLLSVSGMQYTFGRISYIVPNFDRATFWGPLLGVAAASLILQFITITYCVTLVLRPWFNYQMLRLWGYTPSPDVERVLGVQRTALRVRNVMKLQWRNSAITVIILTYVCFLAAVFMQLRKFPDYPESDRHAWFNCLESSKGNRLSCLPLARPLGPTEPELIAVLFLLIMSGTLAIAFFFRVSMYRAWVSLFKGETRAPTPDHRLNYGFRPDALRLFHGVNWVHLAFAANMHPSKMLLGLSAIKASLGLAAEQKTCSLPTTDGGSFETATPEEVGLTSAEVDEALAYANLHGRFSVQIFRNNCLVGRGLLDPLTDSLPWQVWSVTKSVVGMLAGMAIADGKLDIERPISDYLPDEPGWGDAAHRAITVREIFTETSGVQEALIAEAATVLTDPSTIQEFLAQRIVHPPGSYFEYGQRSADAAAYLVQSAVGRDLQEYAQDRLFGPLGIDKSSYFWLRDRSGNSYGYAWLFMAPKHLARLGLTMQNGGQYAGRQVVPYEWVQAVATPSPRNPCYGYLFWNNRGKPCTGANIPIATTVQTTSVGSAPHDLFAMVGALQQNNFMIPSLNMTVTWTGLLGDTAPNLSVLLSAAPGDLYYNFFRILMRAVADKDVPDAGPYQSPPFSLDVNPLNYLNPEVLRNDIVSNPHCNILFCNGKMPTEGLLENLESILGYRPSW
ncbi:beta-lactamase/transpeptidase-like protein [Aspergillus ambiguus]|uniref:beta-lactamase/transpeptidase-like protein n=1 Tax=Aspergillus ambiguus TaxID=176160 RepID=UPI003CCE0808